MSRPIYEIIISRAWSRGGRMKNIKLIRVMKDYTQIKVFVDTGISQSTLSKYENGDAIPTAENLLTLAEYYGTSVDFLLDRTDVKEPYPPKACKGNH